MLDCQVCAQRALWPYIRIFAADTLDIARTPTSFPSSTWLRFGHPSTPRRAYAAAAQELRKPYKQAGVNTKSVKRQYDRPNQLPSRSEWGRKSRVYSGTELKALRELRRYPDPLKLANRVAQGLKDGHENEMLTMIRLASRSISCTVSWNHLLDYHMKKGRTSTAFKTFNEMKKRAQFPDAYTFTILFRGLAHRSFYPKSLSRAVSLYNSLFAENSRVQATTIHTNAMLKVCAQARDMDSLWDIASKIPDHGSRVADARTYKIILSAIMRNALYKNPVDLSRHDVVAIRENALRVARGVWRVVTMKWRAGDLKIDEELVCTMGRLLLFSFRTRDWDDILSLIEQTMDIPRLLPRWASEARQLSRKADPDDEQDVRSIENGNATAQRSADSHAQLTQPTGLENLAVEADADDDPAMDFIFDKNQRSYRELRRIIYVQPSNNTLSLIMQACLQMSARKVATKYWDILTDPKKFAIEPDLDNLHILLRILRQARACAAALDLIENDICRSGLQPTHSTFRIAMSTCGRSKKAPDTMKQATRILDIMEERLETPDAKCVTKFMELAGDRGQAKEMVDAIKRVKPLINNLRSKASYQVAESLKKADDGSHNGNEDEKKDGDASKEVSTSPFEDAVEALQGYVRLFDLLATSKSLPSDMSIEYANTRKSIAQFITRQANRKKFVERTQSENSETSSRESRQAEAKRDEADIE